MMHVFELWIDIGFSSNIVLCIKTEKKCLMTSLLNSIILLCLPF